MIELYAALCVFDVLLLAGLSQRKHWGVITVGIVAAIIVNVALLLSVPNVDGYARHADPREGELLGCYVDEPTWVYLWMNEKEPRAYRVPYTEQLHKVCDVSKKAGEQGIRVAIRKSGKTRGPHGEPRGRFVPYALPPQLPVKGG